MSSFKCRVCSTRIYGAGGGIDVVACPKCRSMTPTGHEKSLRRQLEAYKNHLAYPGSAVGRAIGYAAGIYDQATHLKPMAWQDIEEKIQKRFGATSKASYVAAPRVYGREAAGVVDTHAGLMFYRVEGKNAATGVDWAMIYVVFRGSRGTKQGKANPQGAGWGTTETGLSMNIDWRSNFSNHAQLVPSWCAGAGIHKGFYELYCSMRDTIHRTVSTYLGKNPNAEVIVTGHSLGAALATVCAHDLDCEGICKPFCFPFCSPRVGNLGFAQDFNTRIAGDKAPLHCEANGGAYNRAFIFVQANDPVSWGASHGFKHEMSDKSGHQVADSGNTVKQGIYAALKKDKSDTVIYYHVGNLYRASWFGLHDYNKMQSVLLG